MTVAELIEALKSLPQDAEVGCETFCSTTGERGMEAAEGVTISRSLDTSNLKPWVIVY